MRDGGKGAPPVHPATLTTTASLSATDPAIFLHSTGGCPAGRPSAGDVGRGARAVIPGRSCAGRERGSENGSGAHTRAGTRARTPGAPAPTGLAGPGGGGGEREAALAVRSEVAAAARTAAVESVLLSASGCCCCHPKKKGGKGRTEPALGGI